MLNYKKKYYQLIKNLEEEIKKYYKDRLVSLVIFGSVARDTFRPDSDIDFLLVIKNLPKGRLKRIFEYEKGVEEKLEKLIKDLYKEGIYPFLSPIIKTPEEVLKGSPIFLDMIEGALILYDKNDFFKNYLSQLKEKLKRLGARKVYFKGGYYWELKPNYKPGEIIEL